MIYSGVDLLQVALRIELNGEIFYKKAASITKDAEVRNLLENLANEENKHADFFKDLRKQIESKQIIFHDMTENEMLIQHLADTHVFKKDASPNDFTIENNDSKELLKNALRFEKDTIVFFNELKEQLGDEGKKVVEIIIAEEKTHIRKISDLMKKLNLI